MNAVFDPGFRVQQPETVHRARYQRSRRQDPIATVAALTCVGLAGIGFAFMSPVFVKKQAAAPVVVQLLELPDDPPPEKPLPELDQPPPPAVQVVTPPPQIALPMPVAPVIQQVDVPKPTSPAPQTPPAPLKAAPGPANGGELSTKVIAAEPPRYPLDSRRAREQGVVVLNVLLAADGHVAEISVGRSSGFERLDRVALDAVRGWRWAPLVRDGSPVTVRGVVTIPFVLQGGGRRGDHHGRGRGHDGDDRRDDGPGMDSSTT